MTQPHRYPAGTAPPLRPVTGSRGRRATNRWATRRPNSDPSIPPPALVRNTGYAPRDEGYALAVTLTVLLVVTVAAAVSVHYLMRLRTDQASYARSLAAFHIAEAGLAKAQWELARSNLTYAGETGMAFGGGLVDVEVAPQQDGSTYEVVARSTLVRGSGVPSTCALRVELHRSRDGKLTMRSWSQLRARKAGPAGRAGEK